MTRFIWLLMLLIATTALVHRGVLAEDSEKQDDDYFNDDYDGDGDQDHGGEDEEEDEEESHTGPPPMINTKARDISMKPGETVKFPCEVDNAENIALLWQKDNTLLFSDKFRSVQDKRIEKLKDNTLEIKNLKPSDAGRYICQLGTVDKLKIVHTLHILLTPRIEKVMPGVTKIIKKGDPLTLECKVTGYPAPTVTWSRKNKNMPNGEEAEEGNAVTFDSVTRKHAGTYECMASNGIGEPATATVDIHVQYAPEIEIEREIVNSEEGYDADLVCEVHAVPAAKVSWFMDGKPVPARGDNRLTMGHSGSRHILQITKITKADFGSYTCHANNTFGRMDKVIRLSGEPSPAKYASTIDNEDGSRTLEWVVESYSPITKYELRYKTKQMSEWKKLHPVVENPEGNVYTVRQELKDLTTGQYETVLLAQNVYGWSDPSIAHVFTIGEKSRVVIAGASGIAEPSMGEAIGVASVQSPLLALLTILSLSTFFL